MPHENSLDLDETPSSSASHPDPFCLTFRQPFHQFLAKLEDSEKLKQPRNLVDANLFGSLRVGDVECCSKIKYCIKHAEDF